MGFNELIVSTNPTIRRSGTNMKLRTTLGALCVLLFATSAQAGTFSYTYLEAGYVDVEFDYGVADVDGDGFGIAGSAAINENFHVFGQYSALEANDFDADQDDLTLGLGLNTPLNETVDLYGRLGWHQTEWESGGFTDDDDGFVAFVGIRALPAEQFEFNADISHIAVGDDDTRFGLGGLFNVTPAFALRAHYYLSSDFNGFIFGVRGYLDRFGG